MKNSPISEDTSRTLRIIGRLADRLQFDPIDKLGALEAMGAMVSMCIAVERLRVDQGAGDVVGQAGEVTYAKGFCGRPECNLPHPHDHFLSGEGPG